MIHANKPVAMALKNCEISMIGFFFMRSAITPPNKEKTTDGAMKDNMTILSAIAEVVMSYVSHPRATICICIAKDAARLEIHKKRKSRKPKALSICTT